MSFSAHSGEWQGEHEYSAGFCHTDHIGRGGGRACALQGQEDSPCKVTDLEITLQSLFAIFDKLHIAKSEI